MPLIITYVKEMYKFHLYLCSLSPHIRYFGLSPELPQFLNIMISIFSYTKIALIISSNDLGDGKW